MLPRRSIPTIGELMIPMINLGTEPVVVTRGTRIAQLVFQRGEVEELEEVGELPPSARGGGGVGRSGGWNGRCTRSGRRSRLRWYQSPALERAPRAVSKA